MLKNDHVAVDLYDGAYGPTLRIDTQTAAALVVVRDLLRGLSEGAAARYDLAEDARFALTGVASVELTVAAGARRVGLRKSSAGRGLPSIRWNLDSEGWRSCVGLVGGLLEASRPGHQYLTTEGEDDVLVELAFREGPSAA